MQGQSGGKTALLNTAGDKFKKNFLESNVVAHIKSLQVHNVLLEVKIPVFSRVSRVQWLIQYNPDGILLQKMS